MHADGNICASLPSAPAQSHSCLSPPSTAGATPSNQSLEATYFTHYLWHGAGTKPGAVQTQATGASRFWSVAGRSPEPNVDTSNLLSAYQYLPHTFGTSAWADAESRALEQAVLTVVQARNPRHLRVACGAECRVLNALVSTACRHLRMPRLIAACSVLSGKSSTPSRR